MIYAVRCCRVLPPLSSSWLLQLGIYFSVSWGAVARLCGRKTGLGATCGLRRGGLVDEEGKALPCGMLDVRPELVAIGSCGA